MAALPPACIAITVVYALILPVLLLVPKRLIATADGQVLEPGSAANEKTGVARMGEPQACRYCRVGSLTGRDGLIGECLFQPCTISSTSLSQPSTPPILHAPDRVLSIARLQFCRR